MFQKVAGVTATIELSVIVPCYKKERVILQDFREKIKVLDSMGISYEIIAVIDGTSMALPKS